jgi:hypothetical protein
MFNTNFNAINAGSISFTQPSAELSASLAQSLASELQAIQAEAMGWIPIGQAYLHLGAPIDATQVIEVVGSPDIRMLAMNVLLLV